MIAFRHCDFYNALLVDYLKMLTSYFQPIHYYFAK